MLHIQTAGREPVRVDLPGGGHILFKPAGTPGKAAGRRAAAAAMAGGEDLAVAGVAFTVALARWGAIFWQGPAGDDGEPLPLAIDQDGAPLAMTPDNVALVLEQSPSTYDAVDAVYAQAVLELEMEKNVSAPADAGTSPGSAGGSQASTKTKPARAHRGAAASTAATANRKLRRASAKAAPTR